ncbi:MULTISPECIES: Hsp70 family protein [Klebsiella/Raoultella group]|uniref:Heat shock protein 70 n=1 Tax=Raoultella terrigena TaxID=577 RepID=A0A3P8M445_RAOTE|nr:Hsp70 family protein [Klebsiella pneumoniae]EKW3530646.1 Hsp70 family protein [Raoultella planticola]VDR29256.1 Heat shock protein 70 [Raoultella terrigena]MDV0941208.1 Hsp70 family protein [Klebsiella pneumoniae]MDV1009422.1 Hsp70 family protein [Klebsiella pneumoniae]MDV1031711.1 Hsp70 family protein [Klebsiella pneumoniae]
MRQKIDYGIDLGTTNSALARMDAGEAVIIKSDDDQRDITASCITFNKIKKIFMGEKAKTLVETEAKSALKKRKSSAPNGYFEFKRTMGTDHRYHSTYMEKDYSSEELSAEILKKLKSYNRDENIDAAVITVPAMFKQSQLDATQRAAELAGFRYCELLQEPIAASIAYGIKAAQSSGYWLVFDFGGGTFDAALMHVEEGIMKVVDTEGDNHLGGKDLDNAITDRLIIPQLQAQCELDASLADPQYVTLLQAVLKTNAEEAKIALSSKESWNEFLEELGEDDDGEEVEAEITLTLAQYESVCEPIFQRAIDIVKHVLKRNGLTADDLQSVILVGGPTFSQTLRRMLKEQLTENIDTSIDPMTAVARGAALFAATRDIPRNLQTRDFSKAQLSLKYSETTVEPYVNLGIRIDRNQSSGPLPETFELEIIRSDSAWSSGKIIIEDDAELLELLLSEGKANTFAIKLSTPDGTSIPCEPATITIINGLKIANATLPYAIGIELVDSHSESEGVMVIEGLGKNATLPAKGECKLKTMENIRPGNRQDRMILPLYEISSGFEDKLSRAILNNFHSKVIITGDDFPSLLPEGSDVELRLQIDASRRTFISVYIPYFDESFDFTIESRIEPEIDSEDLRKHLQEARQSAQILASEGIADASAQLSILDKAEQQLVTRGQERDTKEQVQQHIKTAFLALDKFIQQDAWPQARTELENVLERVSELQQQTGSGEDRELITLYQQQARDIIQQSDIKSARKLTQTINNTAMKLEMQDIRFWVGFIYYLDSEFANIQWIDVVAARRAVQQLKQLLDLNPNVERLREAVLPVLQLMQGSSYTAMASKINTNLLRN